MKNQISKAQKQPLRLSKVERINQAKTELKIREHESYDDLIDLLMYLFVLTGLKTENYLKGLERDFMLSYIRNTYGGYGIDEIKVAFELAVERKLSAYMKKNDDVKHYQNFSPDWFSGVMAGYNEYKVQLRVQLEAMSESKYIEPEPLSDLDFYESMLFEPWRKFKDDGEYNWQQYAASYLFGKLWVLGVLRFSDDILGDIKSDVMKTLKLKKYRQKGMEEIVIRNACRAAGFKKWILLQVADNNDIELIIKSKLESNEQPNNNEL